MCVSTCSFHRLARAGTQMVPVTYAVQTNDHSFWCLCFPLFLHTLSAQLQPIHMFSTATQQRTTRRRAEPERRCTCLECNPHPLFSIRRARHPAQLREMARRAAALTDKSHEVGELNTSMQQLHSEIDAHLEETALRLLRQQAQNRKFLVLAETAKRLQVRTKST